MKDEIKAIIKKNLPAEVGETLKQVLEQGEINAKLVEEYGDKLKQREKEIEILNRRVSNEEVLLKRTNDVQTRENNVSQKERDQKVFEAELKLLEAEKRVNEIVGFTGMVLKSPIYRKSILENENGMTTYNAQTQRNEFVPNGGRSKVEEKTVD